MCPKLGSVWMTNRWMKSCRLGVVVAAAGKDRCLLKAAWKSSNFPQSWSGAADVGFDDDLHLRPLLQPPLRSPSIEDDPWLITIHQGEGRLFPRHLLLGHQSTKKFADDAGGDAADVGHNYCLLLPFSLDYCWSSSVCPCSSRMRQKPEC